MNKAYTTKGQDLAELLPSIELMDRSRDIVEDAIERLGKLSLETILGMSAAQVGGEPQRGRKKGDVLHYGSQRGRVKLSGKSVQLDKPRLRTRDGKEVKVPAYETLKKDPGSGDRVLARVIKGVSTREYAGIFDEAGEEVGVSRSAVSRQVSEASEKALRKLVERPIESRQLAVLMDGAHVAGHVALTAVGVDEKGIKRILGLVEGASENSAVAGSLLGNLIEKGVDPQQPILFVIDGAKALRKAVLDRFPGAQIQRCRIHKVRNVLEHLPLAKRNYLKAKLSLAYRLPYAEALPRLEQIAKELESLHPGAAASLREGLEETLTVSRLGFSELLTVSLSCTNIIESSFSRARHRMRRVTNFSSGEMALRWIASALTLAEQNFRTLKGHKDLWMLKAVFDHPLEVVSQ
jgi:putative transposase